MKLFAQYRRGRNRDVTALCLVAVVALGGMGCSESDGEGISPTIIEEQVQPNDSSDAEIGRTSTQPGPQSAEPIDSQAARDSTPTESEVSDQADFPKVIAAEAAHEANGSWTFSVTISSPYDSPERYADAWRISGPEGEVFGVRELAHDHASEQPFTRSKSGIEIPDEVTEVTVEGRDQLNGWGGETITVLLG